MLAIWSLVPLPFLNPAWTSGSSWFTYCWSLPWRILSIILLACEMSVIVAVVWIFFGIIVLQFVSCPPRGHAAAATAAKSLQSCPTLWDPIDGSPAGSPVPGILQVRTLEWVAISFSHAWKWKVKAKSLSRVQLLATAWTAAHQNPPSMGFSRQEYWSGVPLPSPKFLSTQGQISPCFQPQSSPTFLKRSHFPLF